MLHNTEHQNAPIVGGVGGPTEPSVDNHTAEAGGSTSSAVITKAIRKNRFAVLYGVGIGILILAGATIVANKLATSTQSTSYTWGTEGGAGRFVPSEFFKGSLRDAPNLPERFTISDLYRSLESSPDRFFASLNLPRSGDGKAPVVEATKEGTLEYDEAAVEALLASLRPSSYVVTPSEDSSIEGDIANIYNYIPSSIVGTTTDIKKPMNQNQRHLHLYGIEAGQPIESYFTLWGSAQSQIFKNLFEDRSNPEKIQSAKDVARALFDIGDTLERMSEVPASIKPQHDTLAASYKVVGRTLIPLINAKTDAELLSRLEEYNTLVEKFARDYLAVVAIFAANEIKYDESEPGRVFVFTAMSSASSF